MPELGLPGEGAVDVAPVWNPGGFVNQSFRVSSGSTDLHVKLAHDPDAVRGLRRWRDLHERLTSRYGAPPMRGWIRLPEVSLEGPACDWIAGTSPAALTAAERSRAMDLLAALHEDQALAGELLAMGDTVRSCAEAYLATLHDRFVEDLKGIAAAPPPFLTPELLGWMASERDALESLVVGSPAFRAPADRPTHQDPWLSNLIVAPAGTLYVLDWDGLALGDRMMDWAILLGPNPGTLRSASVEELPGLPFSEHERARFELCARATLLDWVIDPLADWVEAPPSDEQMAIRALKEDVHRRALAAYRARYP